MIACGNDNFLAKLSYACTSTKSRFIIFSFKYFTYNFRILKLNHTNHVLFFKFGRMTLGKDARKEEFELRVYTDHVGVNYSKLLLN